MNGLPFCAVDRDGNHYTDASSASRDDWWWGATILTDGVLQRLERDGLLPLLEVTGRGMTVSEEQPRGSCYCAKKGDALQGMVSMGVPAPVPTEAPGQFDAPPPDYDG